MTSEEKEFIKKINIDKANVIILPAIGLLALSICTYIIPLLLGNFDFGIIFEIISLISMLFTKHFINKYNENLSKTFIMVSIASLGWIIIYDVFIYLADPYFIMPYDIYFLFDLLPIIVLLLQFRIYKNISKADNPEKYKESTDWYYENINRK